MAWNEPGNGNKDPWGNQDGKGPPDLDEVVRKMQRKLGGMFGGGGSDGDGSTNPGGSIGIGLIAIILFTVWILSGIYIVDAAERGVVLRFGAYSETTEPGPHWHFPYPIERAELVNVDENRTAEIGYRATNGRTGGTIHSESLMLTKDENIVDLKIAVQYKVKDASLYLFNVRNPDVTLRQMTESAVRETVGQAKMDFVLTEGRNEIARLTESLLQSMLDDQKTGLMITSVNMQDVQPPEQVQAAFADVVKAREDEVRQKNEAEAYANDIVPRARGRAFRIINEAEAYKSEVIARAEGDTSRFLQVMTEYQKAPEITKERLYLDSMQSVYKRSQKVIVNTSKDSNNVLYLPLDKMRSTNSNAKSGSVTVDNTNNYSNDSMQTTKPSTSRLDVRSRGGR